MKHGHLMQWTVDLRPILSLRSTHVTIVQSTRETGDIYELSCQHIKKPAKLKKKLFLNQLIIC